MKLLKSGIPFLAALMVLAACKDDENGTVADTTAPTISKVEHDHVVAPGDEMDIDFVVEDDLALGQVQINIHNNFDGHDHDHGARLKATPFDFHEVYDQMTGQTRYHAHIHIDIPEDAATGPYHLEIRYFDAEGNEGETYIGDFEIADTDVQPHIAITNFGEDDELEPVEEDGRLILRLQGIVESRTEGGLDEVHITVEEEHDHDHSHGSRLKDEVLYDREWDLDGAPSFNLADIDPVIDLTDAEPGHYELRIKARDVAGNLRIYTREVHID